MEIIKFKTNVGDQEDLAKVAPHLDKVESISKWKLDTESADHILSVSGIDLDPQKIENAVKQAGYKAEIIRVVGIGGGDL